MAIKKHTAKSQKARLLREFRVQQKECVLQAFEDIKVIVEALYKRTFAHWQGGGDSESVKNQPYPVPSVKFGKPKITFDNNGGVTLTFHSMAIDPSTGKAHELWYWLDLGTKTIGWGPEPSARFPVRNRRFTQRSLDPRSKQPQKRKGGKLQWATIQPNQPRKGITPLLLSDTIGVELGNKISGLTLGGSKGWVVSRRLVSR